MCVVVVSFWDFSWLYFSLSLSRLERLDEGVYLFLALLAVILLFISSISFDFVMQRSSSSPPFVLFCLFYTLFLFLLFYYRDGREIHTRVGPFFGVPTNSSPCTSTSSNWRGNLRRGRRGEIQAPLQSNHDHLHYIPPTKFSLSFLCRPFFLFSLFFSTLAVPRFTLLISFPHFSTPSRLDERLFLVLCTSHCHGIVLYSQDINKYICMRCRSLSLSWKCFPREFYWLAKAMAALSLFFFFFL